jgi:hypothetical protein
MASFNLIRKNLRLPVPVEDFSHVNNLDVCQWSATDPLIESQIHIFTGLGVLEGFH